MCRNLTIATTLVFYSFSISWATIINIPADYPTIQQGVNASVDADTVLVQPGTYVENINFLGHNITLGSLFLTTGDTSYIGQTVIDGDSSGSVVSFGSGEDSTAIITGFKIQNGAGVYGGGILCSSSNPTISNNMIINNVANMGGGIACHHSNSIIVHNVIIGNSWIWGAGIDCQYSDPYIAFNIINNNSGDFGGGIACAYNSNPTINSNLIINNHADGYGGGIYCWHSAHPIIGDNIISENSAWGGGGGIACHRSSPSIDNNIINKNRAFLFTYSHGGGIACRDSSDPVINNCTITENIATGYSEGGGGGITCHDDSDPIITNTIFWADSAQVGTNEIYISNSSPIFTYCDVQGGWPGEGNIECDPQFCDPDSGNFYLHYSSCCVGTGQNGENIGVYGVGCWSPCDTYVVGDVNGSGVYDGLDIMYGVAFLKGGLAPTLQCECTVGKILYPAGDVNNSCSYNGLDITYGVAYFKGGSVPVPCQDCPPVE